MHRVHDCFLVTWRSPLARHLAQRARSPFCLFAPSKCPWCMVTHRCWSSCSGRAQCVSAPAISPMRLSRCVSVSFDALEAGDTVEGLFDFV